MSWALQIFFWIPIKILHCVTKKSHSRLFFWDAEVLQLPNWENTLKRWEVSVATENPVKSNAGLNFLFLIWNSLSASTTLWNVVQHVRLMVKFYVARHPLKRNTPSSQSNILSYCSNAKFEIHHHSFSISTDSMHMMNSLGKRQEEIKVVAVRGINNRSCFCLQGIDSKLISLTVNRTNFLKDFFY